MEPAAWAPDGLALNGAAGSEEGVCIVSSSLDPVASVKQLTVEVSSVSLSSIAPSTGRRGGSVTSKSVDKPASRKQSYSQRYQATARREAEPVEVPAPVQPTVGGWLVHPAHANGHELLLETSQADYDESGSGADDWPWDPTTTQSSLGSQQLQQSSVSDASASLASAHRSLAQQQLQSLQRRRSSLGADSTRTGSCTTAPPNLLGSSAHAPAWLLAEQLSKTIAVQRILNSKRPPRQPMKAQKIEFKGRKLSRSGSGSGSRRRLGGGSQRRSRGTASSHGDAEEAAAGQLQAAEGQTAASPTGDVKRTSSYNSGSRSKLPLLLLGSINETSGAGGAGPRSPGAQSEGHAHHGAREERPVLSPSGRESIGLSPKTSWKPPKRVPIFRHSSSLGSTRPTAEDSSMHGPRSPGRQSFGSQRPTLGPHGGSKAAGDTVAASEAPTPGALGPRAGEGQAPDGSTSMRSAEDWPSMRATIEALPDAAAAAAAAAALAAAAQQAPIRKPRGRRQTGGERRKTGGWLGGLFGCFGGSALRGGAVPQPARASAAPAPAAAVADVSKQGASAASSVPAAGGLVAAAAAAGMAAPASETRQGRAPGQAKEQPAAAARAVGNGHGGTGGRGGGHHHRTASQSMAADGRLQAAAQQLVAVGSAVDGGAGGGGRAAPVTGHSSAETTSDAVPELPEILGPLAKRVPSLESKSMTALDCKKKLAVESLPLPAQQPAPQPPLNKRSAPLSSANGSQMPSPREGQQQGQQAEGVEGAEGPGAHGVPRAAETGGAAAGQLPAGQASAGASSGRSRSNSVSPRHKSSVDTTPRRPLHQQPWQEAAAQQAVAALLAAKAGNLWSLPLLQRAGSPAAHSPSITTTTVTAEGLVSSRQSTPGRDPLPVAQAETGVIRSLKAHAAAVSKPAEPSQAAAAASAASKPPAAPTGARKASAPVTLSGCATAAARSSQASPPANTALLEQAVAALAGRPAPAGSYARAPLANVLPLPRVAQPAKPWLTQQPATAPATAPAAAAAAAAGAAKLSASKASPRGRTGYATSAAASIAASRRGSVTAAGSAASGSAGGSGGPSAAGGAAGLSSRRASSSQAQVSRRPAPLQTSFALPMTSSVSFSPMGTMPPKGEDDFRMTGEDAAEAADEEVAGTAVGAAEMRLQSPAESPEPARLSFTSAISPLAKHIITANAAAAAMGYAGGAAARGQQPLRQQGVIGLTGSSSGGGGSGSMHRRTSNSSQGSRRRSTGGAVGAAPARLSSEGSRQQYLKMLQRSSRRHGSSASTYGEAAAAPSAAAPISTGGAASGRRLTEELSAVMAVAAAAAASEPPQAPADVGGCEQAGGSSCSSASPLGVEASGVPLGQLHGSASSTLGWDDVPEDIVHRLAAAGSIGGTWGCAGEASGPLPQLFAAGVVAALEPVTEWGSSPGSTSAGGQEGQSAGGLCGAAEGGVGVAGGGAGAAGAGAAQAAGQQLAGGGADEDEHAALIREVAEAMEVGRASLTESERVSAALSRRLSSGRHMSLGLDVRGSKPEDD